MEHPKIHQPVLGLRLQFLREPLQNTMLNPAKIDQVKIALLQQEIEAMMRKGTIHIEMKCCKPSLSCKQ